MNLPLDFELLTARCRLRSPRESDIPHVFSATRFEGLNEGMLWDPPATEAELREPLVRNLEAWSSGYAYTFSIESRQNGEFLGRVSIRPTPQASVWNIGFWIHPLHQGKGLMTEAAQAVLEFGFVKLGATAIEACYATWNIQSQRVLEKLKMKRVECVAQGFQKRGVWVPEYRMRIERPTVPDQAPTN